MARSPAEIQTDIALTRRQIEHRASALQRRITQRWWLPYALIVGGVVVGVVLARVPLHRVLGTGARTVRTGLTVAGTVGAVQQFLRDQRRRARAA